MSEKQIAFAVNKEIDLYKIEELTKYCHNNDSCKKYETETHIYHVVEGEDNERNAN